MLVGTSSSRMDEHREMGTRTGGSGDFFFIVLQGLSCFRWLV